MRTSTMSTPDPAPTVVRSCRRPTTARDRTPSWKALSPRAAIRTLLALLIVPDGAVAMRRPLPLSTWYALEQQGWRIASTDHPDSYIFRVDQGEHGGPGICTPAADGDCCLSSATRAWYVAATKTALWVEPAKFTRENGVALRGARSRWPLLPWALRVVVAIASSPGGGGRGRGRRRRGRGRPRRVDGALPDGGNGALPDCAARRRRAAGVQACSTAGWGGVAPRSAVRRAHSARRRSGSPQAPGAQRPRHRRRARSARRRQLACWRSQHTLGGLCLLAQL